MRHTRHRDLRTMRGYVRRAGLISDSRRIAWACRHDRLSPAMDDLAPPTVRPAKPATAAVARQKPARTDVALGIVWQWGHLVVHGPAE